MSCDVYTRQEWDAAAAQAAALLHEHAFDRHFGVTTWIMPQYFVFFGNEGPAFVAAMLEMVRQELEMVPGIDEVGAGATECGYSWAMIVWAHGATGSADKICAKLLNRMARAWRLARGLLNDRAGQG